MGDAQAADGLLLLGTTCPNCPVALQALGELIKQGRLGTLRIVNLEQRRDIAAELGVRSVPWVRIGDFELAGLRTAAEYGEWADRARSTHYDDQQLIALLGSGEAVNAARMVERNPKLLTTLLQRLADDQENLNARLAIGVVMEELSGGELLVSAIEGLGALSQHRSATIRADACHYLGLTGTDKAGRWLRARLNDDDPAVVEIAQESLALLSG